MKKLQLFALILLAGGCGNQQVSPTKPISIISYDFTVKSITAARARNRIDESLKQFVYEEIEQKGCTLETGLAGLLVPLAWVEDKADRNWVFETLRWLRRTSTGLSRHGWTSAFGSAIATARREPMWQSKGPESQKFREADPLLQQDIKRDHDLSGESRQILEGLIKQQSVRKQVYVGGEIMFAKEHGVSPSVLMSLIQKRNIGGDALVNEYWSYVTKYVGSAGLDSTNNP